MRAVFKTMEVPEGFIKLLSCCYEANSVRIKVNGHVGAAISPKNCVKQGCPFSPIAYICVFQTFLSLLETSELRGIQVPGPLGDAPRPEAIKATAFADDLLAFLRGPSELTLFRDLLAVYEAGSGARNNWNKTEALLAGGGDVTMPDWWSERRARVKTAIRSLGLDVGDAESVTRRWEEKVNNGISAKADEWRAKRVPATFLGKNLVIKNSCLAKAW